MRNASFTTYVSNLKSDDNFIWKPIKNKKKPQNITPSNTQILDTAGTMGQK
jgi:hypothetical protein